MSLYKRGNTYWVEFRLPDGTRIRESAGSESRSEAVKFHAFRKKQLQDGIVDQRNWQSAVEKWKVDRAEKRSMDKDLQMARWLDKFWYGKSVRLITDDDVRKVIEIKKAETSASNANHYLAFVRALFNKLVEWKWVEHPISVKPYRVNNQRKRFLTEAEYKNLMSVLPEHLSVMVEFSILTGLRKSNVVNLKWNKVDLDRRTIRVDGKDFKNGRDFSCPLCDRSVEILRSQIGKHPTSVFTYGGSPIKEANNTAWKNSLKKAGIVDFRWHDLRHTFASYHAMNGTPLAVIKALGGWESMDMVDRYAHLSQEFVRNYSGNSRIAVQRRN